MTHLTDQVRGETEATFDGAPKDALSDLHKYAQKGACENALKGAFEVSLTLHLCLHLLMQWLMHKCVQNGSYNSGPDATLKGELDGRLNIGFERAP